MSPKRSRTSRLVNAAPEGRSRDRAHAQRGRKTANRGQRPSAYRSGILRRLVIGLSCAGAHPLERCGSRTRSRRRTVRTADRRSSYPRKVSPRGCLRRGPHAKRPCDVAKRCGACGLSGLRISGGWSPSRGWGRGSGDAVLSRMVQPPLGARGSRRAWDSEDIEEISSGCRLVSGGLWGGTRWQHMDGQSGNFSGNSGRSTGMPM